MMRPVAQTYLLNVLAVTDVNARMRRVTVGGDTLADFTPWPGQDVVLHLVSAEGAGVRRRYTIRNYEPANRRFDLDFVRHGHGPGALWAESARPGDEVEVFGPRGKVAVSGAGWQLLAGDESALPAIAEIAQALPVGTKVTALIEVDNPDDEQPLQAAADLDVRWLYREGAAPGTSELLDQALAEAGFAPSDRHVYLFGESRVVRRLRDLAAAAGLSPDEISAKGYWNVGRETRG